jgi:hypothetical protein
MPTYHGPAFIKVWSCAMKTLLPVLLAALLLAGCPETKNPKLPPNAPTPVAQALN